MQAGNPDISSKARDHMEFGLRLQGVLRSKDIRQKDLAANLGMSVSRVSNWCQGINLPSGIHRTRIAQYLEVDPVWLFDGKISNETRNPEIARISEEALSKYGGKRRLMRPSDKRGVVALSPGFERIPPNDTPKHPNRSDLEFYLVEYLDLAESWPHGDGLSAAWLQILTHLKKSDFASARPEKTE